MAALLLLSIAEVNMGTDRYKSLVEEILSPVGISINGNNPWDIRIKDELFYRRVMKEGSLGLGESYMEGWRECERLDEFFPNSCPRTLKRK